MGSVRRVFRAVDRSAAAGFMGSVRRVFRAVGSATPARIVGGDGPRHLPTPRRMVGRFHPLGVHAFLLAVLVVEIDVAVKVWTAALHVLGH